MLPRKEPEVRVVERFPRELRGALFRLNRDRKDEARLRLRLAVHFGVAKPGPNGYQGPGPVVLSRLCDSGPLKRVLMESGADLAVVFSRQIYADTIASGLTLLDPAELCRVRVRNGVRRGRVDLGARARWARACLGVGGGRGTEHGQARASSQPAPRPRAGAALSGKLHPRAAFPGAALPRAARSRTMCSAELSSRRPSRAGFLIDKDG